MALARAEVLAWRQRHAELVVDWATIKSKDNARGADEVARWRLRIESVRDQERALLQRGLWRGGPRTLLAALNIHHLELAMTAGLAWLLRPDGHHGLGPAMLTGLLAQLGIDEPDISAGVRVTLEESREETRADLVLYGQVWSVLIESKTFAPEQHDQLFRLYERWKDEPAPRFVFLTRGERPPTSAGEHLSHWTGMTWSRIAALARESADAANFAAPGVREYIDTLEAYHHV